LYFCEHINTVKNLFSIEILTKNLSALSSDALICPSDDQFNLFAKEVSMLFPSGKPGFEHPGIEARLPAGMAAAMASNLESFPYLILASLGSGENSAKPAIFRKAIYYSLLVAEANQFSTVVISIPDFLLSGLAESELVENLVEMLRKSRSESGILKTVGLWIPTQPLSNLVKAELVAKIPELA